MMVINVAVKLRRDEPGSVDIDDDNIGQRLETQHKL